MPAPVLGELLPPPDRPLRRMSETDERRCCRGGAVPAPVPEELLPPPVRSLRRMSETDERRCFFASLFFTMLDPSFSSVRSRENCPDRSRPIYRIVWRRFVPREFLIVVSWYRGIVVTPPRREMRGALRSNEVRPRMNESNGGSNNRIEPMILLDNLFWYGAGTASGI